MRQKNIIANLRKEKGFSQRELASFIGVSQGVVRSWEKERSIVRPQHFEKLQEVLGVPIEKIVWDEEQDFSKISFADWPSPMEKHQRNCSECARFKLIEDDSLGYCERFSSVRVGMSLQEGCTSFERKNLEVFGKDKFIRSQLKCFCGNCLNWKIRDYIYKETQQNLSCNYWEDWDHTVLPSCLKDNTLKEGVLGKRLRLARKELHEPKSDIAKTLGVSIKVLEEYEQGISAVPLSYLLAFAKHYNVSFRWLVGLKDELSKYNEEDII